MSDREQLVETVTRRVLTALSGRTDPQAKRCADCKGGCAAQCSDKVRQIVAVGAERVSFGGNGRQVPSDLAQTIDHTLLKPAANREQIDRLCDEARRYGGRCVCDPSPAGGSMIPAIVAAFHSFKNVMR